MVAPHDPLTYPDGHTDPFNFLRPLIGYGPETMHMAYNPFYPPDLAHAEKRNASPDRSHNETWDSLVITGVLGLLIYVGLFASIFYYGLKWLKLINSQRQRIAFFALYFGGGIASVIGFYLWGGIAYFGVALPFGMIVGTIAYLTISALVAKPQPETKFTSARSITIIVLLGAVIAHFVEINFGIAIVATRTHFFTYAALLLAVGKLLPEQGEYLIKAGTSATESATPTKKSRKSKRKPASKSDKSIWTRPVAIGTLITGLLLIPLLFEYISNLNGGTATLEILWLSLTRYDKNTISYGVLALLLTTWLAASVLFASESPISNPRFTHVLKRFGTILLASAGVALIYGLWLSHSLARLAQNAPSTVEELLVQTASFEGLLTQF
jgi:cation transport ATPase